MKIRRFWLECDYLADPVWLAPNRSGNLDDIPVSEPTREALRSWARSYDELSKTGFKWPDRQSEREFQRHGRELWGTVREELGAGWHVGYFDEQLGAVIWPGEGE